MSTASRPRPPVPGYAGTIAVACVLVVALLARLLLPRLLEHYERFPAMASMPKQTVNAKRVPADPINMAFVGTAEEIGAALRLARWAVADPLSRASDLAIARSVLLNRPDSTAPVSDLYLFGRRQDLAFEQQVGASARRRHHLRLWRAGSLLYEGRPVWLGDATFDLKAGISHRGWHPTHHIAPEIDEERDAVSSALGAVGQESETFRVTGIGVRVNAQNAEGDRFDTDGELRVVVIPQGNVPHGMPADPGVPPLVALKDRLWDWTHRR